MPAQKASIGAKERQPKSWSIWALAAFLRTRFFVFGIQHCMSEILPSNSTPFSYLLSLGCPRVDECYLEGSFRLRNWIERVRGCLLTNRRGCSPNNGGLERGITMIASVLEARPRRRRETATRKALCRGTLVGEVVGSG